MPKILSRLAWVLMMILSLLVALTAYRYLPRIGPLATNVMANRFVDPFLSLHVAGAATALLVGPFQMLRGVRARWPSVHQLLGRIYVLGCLSGGIGGLALALGVTAGPIASAGFGLLGVGWIVTTSLAWRRALQGRLTDHRAWMIRSFALTLAAVTLRLYLPLAFIPGASFVEVYQAISFLCWVPNLLLAEAWLSAAPSPASSRSL
ncbi:DUF2306 domain-containing protein [Caulobacter sp. BP25]|uniref:DUF2306 domain-containing protein n=1 Tax=Caulobacter sp. BP25 TaxID=2048900 RepID=UPI000C12A24C|nr:DUF2306 domain-containing protein [Caulobacter sp. BP25]PHY17235.1 hypothetical protein CSW59_19590 [Caulobacter sp. BP25]